MSIKKLLPVVVGLVLVSIGAYFVFVNNVVAPGNEVNVKLSEYNYVNNTYGIVFRYPEGYVLEEGEKGDAHRGHYAIVLTRKEDASPRENSEGPPTISIDIYQNNLDQESLLGWLKGSNVSNFKLSDGTYGSTTINGGEAITYRWSGLYEGETTALLHGENVMAFTVTYLTPQDANLAVYREILKSVQLEPVI